MLVSLLTKTSDAPVVYRYDYWFSASRTEFDSLSGYYPSKPERLTVPMLTQGAMCSGRLETVVWPYGV